MLLKNYLGDHFLSFPPRGCVAITKGASKVVIPANAGIQNLLKNWIPA